MGRFNIRSFGSNGAVKHRVRFDTCPACFNIRSFGSNGAVGGVRRAEGEMMPVSISALSDRMVLFIFAVALVFGGWCFNIRSFGSNGAVVPTSLLVASCPMFQYPLFRIEWCCAKPNEHPKVQHCFNIRSFGSNGAVRQSGGKQRQVAKVSISALSDRMVLFLS